MTRDGPRLEEVILLPGTSGLLKLQTKIPDYIWLDFSCTVINNGHYSMDATGP